MTPVPNERPEIYICVDVETAGPNPTSIRCSRSARAWSTTSTRGFYVELKPLTDAVVESPSP